VLSTSSSSFASQPVALASNTSAACWHESETRERGASGVCATATAAVTAAADCMCANTLQQQQQQQQHDHTHSHTHAPPPSLSESLTHVLLLQLLSPSRSASSAPAASAARCEGAAWRVQLLSKRQPSAARTTDDASSRARASCQEGRLLTSTSRQWHL
jgi:hypothetical protein